MAKVKDVKESYDNATETLNELQRAIHDIVERSGRTNDYIKRIIYYLNEIIFFIDKSEPLSVDILLLDDIQKRLYPSIEIIDKAVAVTDENFSTTFKTIKSLYDDYILIFSDFRLKYNIDLIDEKYKANIVNLSEELERSRESVIALEPEINKVQTNLSDAGIKVSRLNDLITEKTFDETTEILSKKFFEKHNELKKERKAYLRPAIILSLILGLSYLFFYIYQFCNNSIESPIKYENHLMLIAVCSPIIFLTIWMFFQANRLTRLAELYSYKSNLGCTIKEAVDYVQKIENDGNGEFIVINNGEKFNKETLRILENLLYKLYEPPINHKEDKNQTLRSLSEVTALLGEVKGLVDSVKSTKVEDNGK